MLLFGCVQQQAAQPSPPSSVVSPSDARNPTSARCHWNTQPQGYLPDPLCTPGAIIATATVQEICVSGYSATVRDVSEKTKKEVYAEYGITNRSAGEYEIDHLIPLCIGGSNDVINLFPEPATPTPGFHQKDILETCYCRLVCKGKLPLAEAQNRIKDNWTTWYNQIKDGCK